MQCNIMISGIGYIRNIHNWDRKFFISGVRIFKSFYRGKLVGNCFIRWEKDGSVVIKNLVVDPNYRHNGIATNLIKSVERMYNNTDITIVPEANDPTLVSFYESRGFKRDYTGNEPGYDDTDPVYWKMRKKH